MCMIKTAERLAAIAEKLDMCGYAGSLKNARTERLDVKTLREVAAMLVPLLTSLESCERNLRQIGAPESSMAILSANRARAVINQMKRGH